MERLRLVLIIAACGMTARTSLAQFPHTSGLNTPPIAAQESFVVIGDVKNFNYFPLSATQPTTVREAVLNAGLFAGSATVSVLRGAQDRTLWTQMISPDSGDSCEFVMNGDVLIVQSMTPIAEPIQKCAALRTEAGVIIVALADETVAIGDVLQQTNTLAASGQQQLKIICRLQGVPTVANALMTDKVIHGDVIALTADGQNALTGFGGMAPSFSEWRETAPAILAAQSEVESAPLTIEAPNVPSEDADEYSLQIPASFQSTPVPDDASRQSDSRSSDPFVEVGPSDNSSSLEVLTISQTSQVPDSAASTAPAAPLPPAEVPLLATPELVSAEISPWNLVFIGGLLIAGMLILAGSLRADDETSTVRDVESAHRERLQISDLTRSETSVSPNAAITALAAEDAIRAAERQAAATGKRRIVDVTIAQSTSMNPVASTEWFSGEWRTGQLLSPLAEEVSQGTSPLRCELLASAAHASPSLNAATIAEHSVDIQSKEQLFDLEDLIQNRLPIDLCETRLPLRISLYGRPAGPRRLRIDGAHTLLAGPHSNIASDRMREDATAVGASATASRNPLSGSGPDRALHSLQERTDS